MIRPFRIEDHERLRWAIQAVYRDHGFPWDPKGFDEDLFDIPGAYDAYWVAEVEGLVVGGVGLNRTELSPGQPGAVTDRRVNATNGELVRLYLHPTAQGQGLGQALVQTVIDQATAWEMAALEIWSDKKLTQAHALYQKMGARIVGERLCDDIEESPEWGFYLPLQNHELA